VPRAAYGAAMALLSSIFRNVAITGRTDQVIDWCADRQGGRWAQQTVRKAFPPPRAAPPPRRDSAVQLRELDDLHTRGLVSDAEYAQLLKRVWA
jgi:predicted RNA-binding Zn ribbon-like protein